MEEVGPLLISPCPSPSLLDEASRRNLAAVVNVDPTCKGYYPAARRLGVRVVEFPMPPSGISPVEELNELALALAPLLRSGRRVLIHGSGEPDDRCYAVASALLAAAGLREAAAGPLSLVQDLALTWYGRLLELLGAELIHELYEIGKRYEFGGGLEHASTVANVGLDVARALADAVEVSDEELRVVYAAGLLHDVGRFFSEFRHEETGVRILEAHRDSLKKVAEPSLVAFCVRYHRRRRNPEEDPAYPEVGEKGALLAAIVRLADAFTSVYGKEEYWGAHFEEGTLVVTARGVDRHRFRSKGKLLEKIAGIELEVRSPF